MRYVVVQEFKTPQHRFPLGTLVDDTEIDGPLTALDWVERGYLGSVKPTEEDLTALQEEAAALGIEIDGRWGAVRLREAIEAKKAEQQAVVEELAEVAAAEPTAPAEVVAEQPDTKRRRS